MSDLHDSAAHPRAEDDHVDSRTVVVVGVSALAIFTVAALSAMAYLRHEVSLRPPPELPAELGQSKIGLVEQSPFFEGLALRGEKDRAARLARLQGLGWVDQAHRVAHIPIEEAMALVVQGARPSRLDSLQAPPLGAAHGGVDAPSVPIAAPPEAAPVRAAPKPPARGGAR